MSIVKSVKVGLVVGARSMMGNSFNGHIVHKLLEKAEIHSEVKPLIAFVDREHRGVQVAYVQIRKAGQRRGVTRRLTAMIKRRCTI